MCKKAVLKLFALRAPNHNFFVILSIPSKIGAKCRPESGQQACEVAPLNLTWLQRCLDWSQVVTFLAVLNKSLLLDLFCYFFERLYLRSPKRLDKTPWYQLISISERLETEVTNSLRFMCTRLAMLKKAEKNVKKKTVLKNFKPSHLRKTMSNGQEIYRQIQIQF